MIWFSKWRESRRHSSRIDALSRRVEQIRAQRQRSDRELDARVDLLQKLRDELNEQLRMVDKAIDEARAVSRSQEIALDTANEQIRMLQDIHVAGLVAVNQSLVARFEAETAVQTARATAIQTAQKSGID